MEGWDLAPAKPHTPLVILRVRRGGSSTTPATRPTAHPLILSLSKDAKESGGVRPLARGQTPRAPTPTNAPVRETADHLLRATATN